MHGGASEPAHKSARDRHGDRARKDAWFARRQADTCLRFEVDRPGRAMFIDVGPGPEPYWLPRGKAVPYYHTLRILVRCDGAPIPDSSGGPRMPAAGVRDVGRGRQTWLRTAELCEQTIEEYLDSGAATDTRTRRKLMIRARVPVSHWGTGWLMSHPECEAALTGLNRALATADTSHSDADGPDAADVQAGVGG